MINEAYQVYDNRNQPVWGAHAPTRSGALKAWWAVHVGDGVVPSFAVGSTDEWRSQRRLGWSVRFVHIAEVRA